MLLMLIYLPENITVKNFMKACNMAVSYILCLIIYMVNVKVSVDYFNEVLQSSSYLGSKM
jgi:hypothetical protein